MTLEALSSLVIGLYLFYFYFSDEAVSSVNAGVWVWLDREASELDEAAGRRWRLADVTPRANNEDME